MRLLKKWIARLERTPEPISIDEDAALVEALREVGRDFDALESLFNMTDDTDMIDYYAHQYKALNARYAYLIKQARDRGISYRPRIKETVIR